NYPYFINRSASSEIYTLSLHDALPILQRFSNGIWKNIGNVKSQIQGNELMISLSYEQLGVPKKGHSLELKWTDNMQKDDPMDWYINGDAAPGARFNLKVHF